MPKHLCERFGVIPVAVKDQKGHKKLLLAMCDPTDYEAVQQVEFTSGHTVVSVVALESDVDRAVRYCYHPSGLRESHGLSEMAEVIEFESGIDLPDETKPVIINPEGELAGLEHRHSDIAVRALVDILVAKGIVTAEEFRQRLSDLKSDE